MPLHDWTRVLPNQFHHLHLFWIAELSKALNGGILPEDFYAAAEQRVFPYTPDVLTLKKGQPAPFNANGSNGHHEKPLTRGGVALKSKASVATDVGEAVMVEEPMQRYLTIRHNTHDTLVAAIEIVSPANKDGEPCVKEFVRKAEAFLLRGVHLLVIDPFPPTKADPNGLHALIWDQLVNRPFQLPATTSRVLSSYQAQSQRSFACFVETLEVGEALKPMPLFLTREDSIDVPLEETYQSAFEGFPKPWKKDLA